MNNVLEKTIFGNFKSDAVERYIAILKREHTKELMQKNNEIADLKKELEAFKKREQGIGEAMIYAQSYMRHTKDTAQQHANFIIEQAQKKQEAIEQKMLTDISLLTHKTHEAQQLYMQTKLEIKENLDALDYDIQHIIDNDFLENDESFPNHEP